MGYSVPLGDNSHYAIIDSEGFLVAVAQQLCVFNFK